MTWIGLIAGALTSIAAIPQVVKTIRTKSTRDLSLWQPLLLTVGVSLWILYGFTIRDIPLITMNILPLIANVVLAVAKITAKEET